MTYRTASRAFLDRLNAEAEALVTDDVWPAEAIRIVARRHDMALVSEDGQCEVYRLKGGLHVNAWIEAPDHGIADGGQGFDDNVDWAERLAEQGA